MSGMNGGVMTNAVKTANSGVTGTLGGTPRRDTDNFENRLPVQWAVLWVRTTSEKLVIGKLKNLLDCGVYEPFMPTWVKPIVRKGKVIEKRSEFCFPGYVFVRVAASVEDFFRDVYSLPYLVDGAFRFVNYGTDKKDVFMHGGERDYLERLMNGKYVIDASIGYMEGDRVRIKSGPLMGMESYIIRVNKPQRMAVIAVEMMGRVVETALMLEVIEKVKGV